MDNNCKVENCQSKLHFKTGYCRRHYEQIKRNGKITRIDKIINNTYNIYNNIVLLDVYKRDGTIYDFKILIDFEDLDKISGYLIGVLKQHNKYYSEIKRGRKFKKYLHRFILNNYDKNVDIDHINGNSLDNRKCNLRIVSHKDNCRNRKININNTSGYNGVSFDNRCKLWVSNITIDNKYINLGYSKTKEEAILKRKEFNKIIGFTSPSD